MGSPYVSHRKLVENSLSAMLAAIEIYNKPQVPYREEIVVVMVVNAWELALKGVLRKEQQTIFYRKQRHADYRSLSISDCLNRISAKKLWPDSVDGTAVRANLEVMISYRDQAIHLYPATGIALILYNFLQQSILNYRDLLLTIFNKDLADQITWRLLPLGAVAPTEDICFMKVDASRSTVQVVESFLADLRTIVEGAESKSADMSRVATVYDVNLRSIKQIESADLAVAVDSNANAVVIQKKIDPNETHPHFQKGLMQKLNKSRKGRELNTYDLTVMSWKHGLRSDLKYAWKPSRGGSYQWSGDALTLLCGLSDEEYDQARAEYRADQRRKRLSKNK